MASISRDNKKRPLIHYIATADFSNDIYSYTTQVDSTTFQTTGTLAVLNAASTLNKCGKGRILRETGRRLFPGGSYPGVSTLMVSVYDDNSCLSGLIDPNAEVFAYYNVDKPVEVINGLDPNGNAVHRGQSMYTSGNVLADGGAKIGGNLDVSGASNFYSTVTLGISSSLLQQRFVSTLGAGAATVPSPTPGSIFVQSPGSATQALTLPSAATLWAALGNPTTVGLTFDFTVINGNAAGGNTIVLTAVTNVVIAGNASIASIAGATSARFTVRLNGYTAPSTVDFVVYRS